MTKIWAKQALLSSGWAKDVEVEISGQEILAVTPDAAPQGTRVTTLLPAPVNLHSHAFQRAMAGMTEQRGKDPRDTFWTWRRLMFQFLDRLTPDHVEAIAAFVQMEMLEAGYATNTEFHYLHHQPGGAPYDNLAEMSERIAAAATISGIGLTLLPVHYQFGGCDRRALSPGQIRFGTDLDTFFRLYEGASNAIRTLPDAFMGVAPHSLRAVAPDCFESLQGMTDGPLHMHLAEQVAEVDEVKAHLGARPVEWVLNTLDVTQRWCFIHCTQMEPQETAALARSGAIAGLCPITESSLGDGIFDGVRWQVNKGRFGVGSDSNIRISLSEELRTLDYSQRLRDRSRAALATPEKSTGRVLFEEVVFGGAQAADRRTGKIAPGFYADLLALDGHQVDLEATTKDETLDMWIFAGDDRMVQNVWSAGRHVVQDGNHIHREKIEVAYRGVMADLRGSL